MMCRRDHDQSAIYGAMKNVLPDPGSSPFGTMPTVSPVNPAAIAEYQRLQLYDYAQVAAARSLRFAGHPAFTLPSPYSLTAAFPSLADGTAGLSAYGFTSPFVRFDPRARFVQEEPKPQHSYIGLIAMAILSSPDKKMVLSDIYQYILDQYPYFRNRGPGWRNSIRHNLSLNDCFIKAGRSANGKGHYWAIHPANIEDFKKGDFRRRKAQRKVRKHMGLSVPDDDDSPTPTPPPAPQLVSQPSIIHHPVNPNHHDIGMVLCPGRSPHKTLQNAILTSHPYPTNKLSVYSLSSRQKRQFDMESLLAPDPVRTQSPDIESCAFSPPLPHQNYLTTATTSSTTADIDGTHSPIIESPPSRGSPIDIKDEDPQNRQDHIINGDKDLATPRPILASTANLAMRRAMQWTMSLPLPTMTATQQPNRVHFSIPFGTSCWTPQQVNANSFLTTHSTCPTAGNHQQIRPADLSSISCASPNPLVHRWQETLHRIDQDNGQKSIEQ